MNDRRKNLSLAEIGRRFHVSAATVSNILNNKGKFSPELAGKILAFVDEVEYRPNLLAQSLKGNSKIVGFCLRGNLEDPWYIRVMAEVQNGLRRHGFYVGTVLGEQDLLQVRQTLDLFIQLRAAAVVLGPLGYTAEYEELRPVLDKLNFVTAFDTLEPMPLPSVRVNVYRAACGGVRHLYDCGHRRIGFLLTTLEAAREVDSVRNRFEGYRQALADAKLEFDPALISELGPALSHMRPSDVGLELFSYPAMNRLLHLPCPPTAVLLLWDELAPGAIAAIRDTRREVPRDVSLVGFNDDELCTLITPRLSTVRQDGEAMGEAAVRLLAERINRNTPIPPRTLVPSRFINRDTTASLTK